MRELIMREFHEVVNLRDFHNNNHRCLHTRDPYFPPVHNITPAPMIIYLDLREAVDHKLSFREAIAKFS